MAGQASSKDEADRFVTDLGRVHVPSDNSESRCRPQTRSLTRQQNEVFPLCSNEVFSDPDAINGKSYKIVYCLPRSAREALNRNNQQLKILGRELVSRDASAGQL